MELVQDESQSLLLRRPQAEVVKSLSPGAATFLGECLRLCDRVTEREEGNVKALWRKAQACVLLGKVEEGVS